MGCVSWQSRQEVGTKAVRQFWGKSREAANHRMISSHGLRVTSQLQSFFVLPPRALLALEQEDFSISQRDLGLRRQSMSNSLCFRWHLYNPHCALLGLVPFPLSGKDLFFFFFADSVFVFLCWHRYHKKILGTA